MVDVGLYFPGDDQRFRLPQGWVMRGWQKDALSEFKAAVARSMGFFTFSVYAGVGSGKTGLAAVAASDLLRRKVIDRVVFVCNNRTIKAGVRAEFARFGIHLTDWSNKKHSLRGEGPLTNGALVTYQALANSSHAHAAIASQRRTLVIFDEIHHLGEDKTWADAAQIAFDGIAVAVIALSGTPYRTDERQIPFASYVLSANGLYLLKADVRYTLGQAINDKVCRRPNFRMASPTVVVQQKGQAVARTFDDPGLTEEMASLILSEAVRPGSEARRSLTKDAIDFCRNTGGKPRKLIIFVDRKEDAEISLPMELAHLGINPEDIVSVTSDTPEAPNKIKGFGKSDAWILITVDMVSEGTDIPPLEVALFLSSVTARTKTIQRIGRILRGSDHAYVFMFKHPYYVQYAIDIEDDIQEAIKLKQAKEDAEPDRENGKGGPSGPKVIATSSKMDGLISAGHMNSEAIYSQAYRLCQKMNLDPSRDLPGIASAVRQGIIPFEAESTGEAA